MQVHVGDRVVVEGAKVGQPPRRGEVVEILRGAAGDRLRVRWEGSEHDTVLAPGTDVRIEPREERRPDRIGLRIDISLTEDEDHTDAVARLRLGEREFSGWGRARRHPTDPQMPVVGEELAISRALSDVSHQLVGAAAGALEEALGKPVALNV